MIIKGSDLGFERTQSNLEVEGNYIPSTGLRSYVTVDAHLQAL